MPIFVPGCATSVFIKEKFRNKGGGVPGLILFELTVDGL
jgi:hypothetical protein